MFFISKIHFLAGTLLLLLVAGSVSVRSSGLPQETNASIAGAPMAREEVMARVKSSFTAKTDFDDIAADIDRRGINFEVDQLFASQIRFMRATIVTNALWRADDRRKALLAKPKNTGSPEELQGVSRSELDSLPFIEQVRAANLAYVASLPNFIVSQQVQRYERRPSSSWKLGDYLELAVSYASDRGEEIKLKLQNGRAAQVSLDQVGGLTSTGQFAGQLAMLFNPDSRAEFAEQEKVDFYGQPCVVYKYYVATKNSRQQLKIGKAQVITGFRGRIYIQRDSKQVLRMEQESVEIPFDFPISAAVSAVDYGWVTISNKDFLLPVSAQVSLTSKQDRVTVLNCITFHKYNKFETDVKIVE
jgi:hypothetical protein